MTALEYRDTLKRLGLSIEDAAKLQGIPTTTSRKRAVGSASVPPEAVVLLRLMLAMRLDPMDVMKLTADAKSPADPEGPRG